MSTSYVFSLVVAVISVVALRLWLGFRGRPARKRRPSRLDAVLIVLGWLGLGFHCGAMFFASIVTAIPGTGPLAAAVNAMGTPSIIAFAAPAVLILLGLRRARPTLVGAVLVALVAVGTTMYNGSSLEVHLTTIFLAVVVMAFATAEVGSAGRTGTQVSARWAQTS